MCKDKIVSVISDVRFQQSGDNPLPEFQISIWSPLHVRESDMTPVDKETLLFLVMGGRGRE